MKRDIKLNIYDLEQIHLKIETYIESLEQLESASNTFLETIKEQDSQAYEKLSTIWEKDIVGAESLLKERFEIIATVLTDYMRTMESYIAAKDPTIEMRVDRNDIYWNYNQIAQKSTNFWDMLGDIGSSGVDYQRIFIYNRI